MKVDNILTQALPFLAETLDIIDEHTRDAKKLVESDDTLWCASVQHDLDQAKKYRQRYKGQVAIIAHITNVPKSAVDQLVEAYRTCH